MTTTIDNAKERIRKTVTLLKSKQVEYSEKAAQIERGKAELQVELGTLQAELKTVDGEQQKSEGELTKAKTQVVIDELTKKILDLQNRRASVLKAIEGNAGKTEKLLKKQAQNFCGAYPSKVESLKKKRDVDYQKMTDCIKNLSELHKNLLCVEAQWQGLLSERNSHAAKIGAAPLASSGWNISVETVNGSIGYALPSDFGAFLSRLGEIIGSGVKLIA